MARKVTLGNLTLSWHERNEQWRKSIGWKPDKSGTRRVPAEFYFGPEEARAFMLAQAKLAEWAEIIDKWPQLKDAAAVLCRRMDCSRPFWLPSSTEDEAQRVSTLEAALPSNVSIEAAQDAYEASLRVRLGLMGTKGLKQSTFNTTLANLGQALVATNAAGKVILTAGRFIHTIGYADISAVINFHYRKGGVSERTALNYCRAFQMFLEWMDNQPNLTFQKPKGMDALFKLGKPASDPRVPTVAEIGKIVRACRNDEERLYVLLGINCGMYESDIASLTHGVKVAHRREPHLWWKRGKTSHQNTFHTMHWLFPETLALLDSQAAAPDNPHGRLLLHDGKPILDVREGYRVKFISEMFTGIIKRAKMEGEGISFKNLRKFGANQIRAHAKNDKNDMARKFLGQTIPGVLKDYVRDDFDDLTVEMKRFHRRLVAAKVLPVKS